MITILVNKETAGIWVLEFIGSRLIFTVAQAKSGTLWIAKRQGTTEKTNDADN